MSGQQELLKLLEVISQRVQHHHDALWEEAKHYSWWIYILLAGLVSLYLNLGSLKPWVGIPLTVLGNLFGCVLSLIGYNAVRREGKMFHEARQIRARIFVALRLNQPMPKPHEREFLMPQKDFKIKDFISVKSEANKSFLGLWGCAIVSLFSTASSSLCGLLARVFKKKPNENKKSNRTNFGIRDGFQLTFLITALLFIALLVVSVITLLRSP